MLFADWADWLISYVPEPIKKPINEEVESLKSTISNLFPFEIVESKSAIKGFTKQHKIDGRQGIDAETFLNTDRPLVINFLERNRGIKLNLVRTCTMEKISILTGEVVTDN